MTRLNALLAAAALGGLMVGPSPSHAKEMSPSTLFGQLESAPIQADLAPWRPRAEARTKARAARVARQRLPKPEAASVMLAGASAQVITPTDYEIYTDINDDATYQADVDVFDDTGVDRLWDVDEPGALGPDGEPGRAGFDDDFDGAIDEGDEYGSLPSDDVADPSGDNYHRTGNPDGTEGNGEFDALALAGFGGLLGVDIRPAVGVHDDLWSRALAVSDYESDVIFIVNDAVGMLFHWMNPVKRALAEDLGVPVEHIIISNTHTHQAPDTVGIWAGPLDYDYMARIMDKMYDAGVEAYANMESVGVRSTTVETRACYDKVTLEMKPLTECVESDFVPDNLSSIDGVDRYIVQNDLRDPWVRRMAIPVQQFVGEGGNTVATVVSFDTHPEVLLDENQLMSSDYPHWTRAYLEERFGGVGIFLTGAVGCQMGALRGAPIPLYDEAGQAVYQDGVTDASGNPVPEWANGAEARARSQGYEVGHQTADGIAQAGYSSDLRLSVKTEPVDVKITNPVYRLIIKFIARQPFFEEQDAVIDAPYCTRLGCVRTDLSIVTIADMTYITVPGEFPPEYVIGRGASVAPYSETTDGEWEDWSFPAMPPLIVDSPSRDLMLVGLANNYFGYAVPEADHVGFDNTEHPNYYEEVYAADPCFGDMIGNKLLDMLDSRASFNPACRFYP